MRSSNPAPVRALTTTVGKRPSSLAVDGWNASEARSLLLRRWSTTGGRTQPRRASNSARVRAARVVSRKSLTYSRSSASPAAAWARRIPSASITSALSRSPAVSKSSRGMPSMSTCSRTMSRVVPGRSVTIEVSCCVSRFISEDLPTLGSPSSTARTPSFITRPLWLRARSAARSDSRVAKRSATAGSARRSRSSSGKSRAASTHTRSELSWASKA